MEAAFYYVSWLVTNPKKDLLLLISLRNSVSWNLNLTNYTIGKSCRFNVAAYHSRLLLSLIFNRLSVQLALINLTFILSKDWPLLHQDRLVNVLSHQWIWDKINIVPLVWWVLIANFVRNFCFFVIWFIDFRNSFKTLLNLNLNLLSLLFGIVFIFQLLDFSFGNN